MGDYGTMGDEGAVGNRVGDEWTVRDHGTGNRMRDDGAVGDDRVRHRVGDDRSWGHRNRGMSDDRGSYLDRSRSIVASHPLIGDLLGDSIPIVHILYSLDNGDGVTQEVTYEGV